MTTAQLQKTEKMMSEIAKESVTVENICGCIYVYGSELAVLRIFAKYQANGKQPNSKALVGYSDNKQTHYFVLEPNV